MRYFIFNDVDSRTFNTYIATSNIFDSAKENVEIINVPGRNGPIYFSQGTFEPFVATMNCYIPSDMETNINELKQFLQSQQQVAKLFDSLNRNVFRLARFLSSFTLSASDRKGAAFTLEFNCMPQKFLVEGETITTLKSSGTITNPSLMPSKPLLRVYGTGTLTIGEYELTILNANEYTDIDCEIMQCYKGTTNCNNNVEVDEFPVLVGGDSEITLGEGITQVDITGRWWIL